MKNETKEANGVNGVLVSSALAAGEEGTGINHDDAAILLPPTHAPTHAPVTTASDSSTLLHQSASSPPLPRWYPHWRNRPVFHGNGEALGWALDSTARAVAFVGSGAFLGPALLQLAKQAAGCDIAPGAECDARVYGIRPSSLLTTYTTVVGILSSLLLPMVGALVDCTPHRRLMGRITSSIVCLLIFPQIFLNSNTWFAVAIIHIAEAFVGWAQTLLTYSYLPELTTSESRLTQLTQSFTVVNFGGMVLYLVAVVAISTVAGISDDLVATARLGQSVSFLVAVPLLYAAWAHLFQTRPAAHPLPPNRSLWTAGFVQVYTTTLHISRQYRALLWFLVSVAWIDAATQSLVTIAITYLTDKLQFTSQENGIAVLLMLLGSIPGGVLGGWANSKCNPIRGSLLATMLLSLNTLIAALVLVGPGQQIATYALAFGWGVGTGWKATSDKTLVAAIVPAGQDTELMGLYLFSGQVLTWLPPLAFTALNEAGVSQRVGIATLAVYYGLGMLALLIMGPYRAAVELAGRVRLSDDVGEEEGAEARDQDRRDSPDVELEAAMPGGRVRPKSPDGGLGREPPVAVQATPLCTGVLPDGQPTHQIYSFE